MRAKDRSVGSSAFKRQAVKEDLVKENAIEQKDT